MRAQKKFSILFGVTERYADYLSNEERTLSSMMAREVGLKLNIPLETLLFLDCRGDVPISKTLSDALEKIDLPESKPTEESEQLGTTKANPSSLHV